MRKFFDAFEKLDQYLAAGFTEEQARLQIQTLQELIEYKELATKRDIKELDTKIETAKKELDAKIETTKAELKHDFFVKMAYFSLAIISIQGSLMAYMKFFAQ